MGRAFHQKPKPRYARATAQIVVEGYTEEAFCKHLRTLFGRDCGVRVEIFNVRGGSPQDVVIAAIKRKGFDRTFVFFDSDVELPKLWAAKSKAAGHIHLLPSPCVEAFLLDLLGNPCHGDTSACKKAFDKLLPPPRKYLAESYAPLYPRTLLECTTHPLFQILRTAFQLP